MYCSSCGAFNQDNARFCAGCGRSLGDVRVEGTAQGQGFNRTIDRSGDPDVPNYLVQAILVTILCCLPFGIVAIVFAAQVNGRLAAGDIAGARRASANAKTWAWVSFGVGAGFVALYLVLLAFGLAV